MSLQLTKKLKQYKKFNSDTRKSFSNSIQFKPFISKHIKDNLYITIVPSNISIYQGTDYNFKKNKKEDYFDYYNERHYGAYFVSSYEIASIYATKAEFTNIIYTTIPDKVLVESTNNDLYPLYYIESKGYIIKFKLNRPLKLLNIGDLNTVQLLYDIITNNKYLIKIKAQQYEQHFGKSKPKTKEDIEFSVRLKEYEKFAKNLLYKSCALSSESIEPDDRYKHRPEGVKRTSSPETDDHLIIMFKQNFIPYIKKNYKIDIDGWIYYQNDEYGFHDEMLIYPNTSLVINKITSLPSSLLHSSLNDIPSREQFLSSMKHKKIVNNTLINKNNILSFC